MKTLPALLFETRIIFSASVAVFIIVASVLLEQAQQTQPSTQDQLYASCGQTNKQLAKMLDVANTQVADMKKQLEAKAKPEEKK